MKVLMINSVCGIRSTGRICTDIATQLEQQGHEVKIAYGREQVPEKFQKYAVRIGSDLDVKLHGAQSRLLDNSGFASKQATKKFIEWVKSYDPDVIHLHNIHGYYLDVETLFRYLKTCGKRVLWTLHDCWSFTGHCSYFEWAGCEKWKTGCEHCPQKKSYPTSLLLDRSKQNYEKKKALFCGVPNLTLVTPSQWLADLCKQSFLKEYPVQVIYNGVDTAAFCPKDGSAAREKYGLGDKKVILGVAAIWNDRKGLAEFLKLSEKLGDEYRIVLVGLTKEQIDQLPENIVGIPRTANVGELAELYSLAEYFFNPTFEDNYPTTNIEAIACGTPAITYNTGGSVEGARLYGAIVEKGDVYGAAEVIRNHAVTRADTVDVSTERAVKEYLDLIG